MTTRRSTPRTPSRSIRRRGQLGFEFRTWGGKRTGAGRKPASARAGVAHRPRPELPRRLPLHVTLRMAPEVLHLMVEAASRIALGRAIKGLSVRIAKGLNQMMHRSGRVLDDRYHAHALRTPTEVKRALLYIRDNAKQHAAQRGEVYAAGYVDAYSSAGATQVVLPAAQTWLLREGWKRDVTYFLGLHILKSSAHTPATPEGTPRTTPDSPRCCRTPGTVRRRGPACRS